MNVDSTSTIDQAALHRLQRLRQRWQALSEIAVRGLIHTYSAGRLPHTMRFRSDKVIPQGDNPRYALIALLGLAKAADIAAIPDGLVAELWTRILRVPREKFSPGDLGLGLWASVLHHRSVEQFQPGRAFKALKARADSCDAIELAWLLVAADHLLSLDPMNRLAAEMSDLGYDALLRLFSSQARLYFRHRRPGVLRAVARRVPCFAHQIYPLMALALHAKVRSHQAVLNFAGATADHLCRLQGDLGQWPWLYDAIQGSVIDDYPVFSVHQDGMAPMALAQFMLSGGKDYSSSIDLSLQWVEGENELGASMIRADQGLILRDIHRKHVGRFRRALTATLVATGRRPANSRNPHPHNLVVNRECRPYHLGWVLYAAGLIDDLVRQTPVSRECP